MGGPVLQRKVCGISFNGRTIQHWQLDGRTSGQMGADERKAIWHEVFFNLAFATACGGISSYLIQTTAATATDSGGSGWLHVLAFFSIYLPLYLHFMSHGLYLNRFDNSDLMHNLYQLLNVALMCLAAANVGACTEAFLFKTETDQSGAPEQLHFGACSDFSYIMFALRLLTVVMYGRCALLVPQKTWFCLRKAVELLVFALFWLFNGVLQRFVYGTSTFLFTWWAVTLADLVIPLVTPLLFPQRVGFVAVNIDLLIERFGLFFVTVLGGSVVAATLIAPATLLPATSKIQGYTLSIIIVFLSFCFKLTYHDCNHASNDDIDLHALRWRHWTGILWIVMHLPLTAGIVTMSSYFIQAFSQQNLLTTPQRWYLSSAMALTVLSLSALQLLHKKSRQRVRVGPYVRLAVRLLCAVGIMLLPLLPDRYLPLWALFLCYLLLNLVYTLLDMLGNRAVGQPARTQNTMQHPISVDLADIFQADGAGVHKNIHGMVVGGQMQAYNNIRMRGRDVSSAYI